MEILPIHQRFHEPTFVLFLTTIGLLYLDTFSEPR